MILTVRYMICEEGINICQKSGMLLLWGYLSGNPRWWYLGHAKGRPKTDDVRPKVVNDRSSV